MKLKIVVGLFTLLLALLAPSTGALKVNKAMGQQNRDESCNWTNYVPFNDAITNGRVSVSFCRLDQGNEPNWTWRFRNNTQDKKLIGLEFIYTEDKIDFLVQSQTHHHDVFPGSLDPQKGFGGWAAFLAKSVREPRIQIVMIQFQGEEPIWRSSYKSCISSCDTQQENCFRAEDRVFGRPLRCSNEYSDCADKCMASVY